MVQYVVTPWRNRAELLHIRQQLYPSPGEPANDAERRRAVAQVSVWMQRGNCPHLVESTAILTSAMLNDVPGNSAYCVRAAYSAAFCRFVTGLLDSHQDKRRKLSMYSIAKTIGLPATYVELRHQATHEELPSLQKLRTAAVKALRWIWDYYWVQLTPDIPSGDEDCKTYFRRFLDEKDGESRRKIAERLMRWDEDELISTFTEFNGSVEETGLLLKELRLSKRILDAIDTKGSETSSEKIESMDDIRAEMARMESDLGQSEEEADDVDAASLEDNDSGCEESIEDVSATGATLASEGKKGWSLWEGPWVPKPIGVV